MRKRAGEKYSSLDSRKLAVDTGRALALVRRRHGAAQGLTKQKYTSVSSRSGKAFFSYTIGGGTTTPPPMVFSVHAQKSIDSIHQMLYSVCINDEKGDCHGTYPNFYG